MDVLYNCRISNAAAIRKPKKITEKYKRFGKSPDLRLTIYDRKLRRG
jgi:hypothetical protein